MGRVREWCGGPVAGAVFMAMAVVAMPVAQQPVPAPADVSGASLRGSGDDAPRLRPDESMPPAVLEAFVDGVVRQAMSTGHLAGVAVAIVQDGATAFEKGYGFADLESGRRVDPETTIFRIGSITKTFTWVALMRAVEAGRVGIDDPVNAHLPPDLHIPDDGFRDPIRIRHLMTHTPGFEDRLLGQLFVRDPDRLRAAAEYLRDARPARVRAPGVFSTYSNYGVALAGAILEHVHGRPWQEIVEEEILQPLGLMHTSPREPYPARADLPAPMPDRLAANLAHGYRWTGTGHERRPFEYITHQAPAGAISSSAADMGRYMRMLLDDGMFEGAEVFGRGTAAAFRTPMTTLPPSAGNWAAGFWVLPLPGGFTNYGHDGGTLTFFSTMVLVPELRLGIFVVSNTEGGDRLSEALPARIVERFYAPASGRLEPGRAALTEAADVYTGVYLPTRRPHGGLEGVVFRLMQIPVTVTSEGYLTLSLMGRTQRFVPGEHPGEFRAVDDGFLRGLFAREDGGRVIRFETLAAALEPVGPLFQTRTLMGLAVAALVAALGTLIGIRVRFERRFMATPAQQLAGALQIASALSWLVAAVALAALAMAVPDQATLVWDWPHPAVMVFSAAALVAALLAWGGVLLLPAVWRPRRGVPGWTTWRTVRYTLAMFSFGALGAMLALWGALQPWNP
jgi:CubicO group peptidase (beta-lactamase class C family)